ncbi:transposase [Kocuria sabuli]|uniref:transposase n=1 Tax=Kocuria sabuli TaxID=3071448 RepID=UPI0034D4C8C9
MLLKADLWRAREAGGVARTEISDEAWVVIDPPFPVPEATGRPPVERRAVVEATAWRYRTGVPVAG